MSKEYTLQRLYYGGETFYKSPHVYAFIVEEKQIRVYSFFKLNFDDGQVPDTCYVTNATQFFNTPLVQGKKKQVQREPFCEQSRINNIIKYTDIIDAFGYNYYESSDSSLNLNTLYLKPEFCNVISTENISVKKIDPNSDFLVDMEFFGVYEDTSFKIYNYSEDTKVNFKALDSFMQVHVLKIGTNFGNANSFLDLDFIISPKIKNFISNLTFTNGLNKVQHLENDGNSGEGVVEYVYTDRLRLKVEGPATANVGDILEYNVTLMNNDFTDTYTNAPDLEVYPTTEAGVLLHRKVVLKNGTGKFKVDTSNLYSGDTFDVKIGWKYRTNDSKVTVTVN